MFDVKSPLTYYPMTVGDYTLSHCEKGSFFSLKENHNGWMGYDYSNHWQAREFYIEIELAKGVCITTGLGLGILQTNLCLKEDVTKVIVYEKSSDVIDIFYKMIEKNNFDISKLEIKQSDADTIEGEVCDCLFPDHFESESDDYVIANVRKLSEQNEAKLVWYWPAGYHFLKFLTLNALTANCDSYIKWAGNTGIKNLPVITDESIFDYFQELRNIYRTDAATERFNKELLEIEKNIAHKNKLLSAFKNHFK
jgi:hypothetical protein